MSNAETFEDSDMVILSNEWKEKATPALEAWKSQHTDSGEIARIDNILQRALNEDEGITKDEARILQSIYEEGERLMQIDTPRQGDEQEPRRKDWWRLRQGADGTLEDKVLPEINDPTLKVTTEIVHEQSSATEKKREGESGQSKKERAHRWTPEQRVLIKDALKAIRAKDAGGNTVLESMRELLRNDDALINERAFFDPYGAYAEMMPDEYTIMRNAVAEFRKLPSSAESAAQDYAEEIEARIERWKAGDMTPRELKELEVEVRTLRERIKDTEISEEDESEGEDANGTNTKSNAPRRTMLVNRPWDDKLKKVRQKDEMRRNWKMDANRLFSLYTEEADVLYSNLLQWDGQGTRSWLAADYDDVRHAADVIKTMQREIDTGEGKKIATVEYIVNTTDGAEYGIQKTTNTLRFIDFTFLSTLDFGVTSAEVHGVESQGKHRLVPHLNYVISRPLTAELALLQKHQRFDMLALHPVQLMRLKQGQAQVNAFLNYIHTEYVRGPRNAANKNKVFDAFKKLNTLFAEAIAEREVVLKEALRNLRAHKAAGALSEADDDILEMLEAGEVLWVGGKGNEYGEKYDVEHGKYVRVFRPDRVGGTIDGKYADRTQAWWRLMALTEKYPPVLTDERTQKKVPVPSDDKIADDKMRGKSGKLRRTPRGEGFLSGKKNAAEPLDVMLTDTLKQIDA